MEWHEIDPRLARLGKDRAWLAERTQYSADTLRTALAPASTKRSDRMLSVLARAIEDEESLQAPAIPKEIRPGVFEIFDLSTPEGEAEFALADRASRIVQAPTITDYCRDAIREASERILRKERQGLYGEIPGIFPAGKVAEENEGDEQARE